MECTHCSMCVQVAVAEHLLVARKLKGKVVILTPYRGQKQEVLELVQREGSRLQRFLDSNEETGGSLYVRTINECQGLCSK